LTAAQYAIVTNSLTGEMRVENGPNALVPGPTESASAYAMIRLNNTSYLIVLDTLSGTKSYVKGPCVWSPKTAFEQLWPDTGSVHTALVLQSDEYCRITDTLTGKKWIEHGEALIYLQSTWEAEGKQKKITLKSWEYVRLQDMTTGKITVHRGEKTVVPGENDELVDGKKLAATELKVQDYIKIIDQSTGEIRVERGPKLVCLGCNERFLGAGKRTAIEIDDDNAALVRDKTTGNLRLVTEKQLFVPGPDEVVEEQRELIKLADHEAIIVRDREGKFDFYYGSEEKRQQVMKESGGKKMQPRSFFLQPYSNLVTMSWSRGRRRERRDLYITRFDCRAQYMSFEFNCRTKDNVELVIEGTFFWEVDNLPAMISTTGDAPGDICNHARSQFIKLVGGTSLKDFMADLHNIGKKVHQSDPHFYDVRGIKIHSLEVTRYACAEASTSAILEEIIQETTNRMNRLSQAESENEVNLFSMSGEIEKEKLNTNLLKIKHENEQADAEVDGAAQADRAAAFLTGLKADVTDLKSRITMWETLMKNDSLESLAEGQASFTYTPADVHLTVESRPIRGSN